MSASLYDLIQPLQPFAQALVNLAGRAGVQPRVTSTLRTRSQQQRLYAAYLRGENAYPVAPPGTSAHEYGFAFDMIADSPEDLHDLGTVWRQWGGLWSPEDEVHFEYPGFVRPELPVDTPASQDDVFQRALAVYNKIPWYVQAVLPTAATAQSAKSQTSVAIGKTSAGLLCETLGLFC